MIENTNRDYSDDYSIEQFEKETGLSYQRNMETYRQWKLNKLILITSRTMNRIGEVSSRMHQTIRQQGSRR